ncbi:Uncharacterised protein [uncultured Ruminococcus sp.]|uniref:hypothetical protein n=1 Tax=Hydrogeniiclostridium mannosilyticum TaxID=2764322 RepID=UPI0008233160|nr:Uncharacterised protein [uncultured Ruminococcus sp.]
MEKNAKKKKTLLIVGIVVAVLVVVYIICIATGNVKPAESFSNNQTSSNMTNESSSIKTTEIIWKDEKKYGIANLYLDGTKTKEAIVLSYYKEVKDYIKSLDINQLKDYNYIEFVGNVVREDKIECTIRGNLSINYIKENPSATKIELEKNITDLFIPKPLR